MKIFSAWNITIFLLTYFLIVAAVFFYQKNLQYLPSGKITEAPAGFETKILTTEEGVKILSWFHAPKKNQKIIIYFHGNAGNLSDRINKFETFAADGFGVLAISYQGYPGSDGVPSEAGLISDGKTALDYLLDLGYLPKDFILFGESLGSGVAVQLAAKIDVAGVVLESPFASVANVAKKTYWFLPVDLILQDRFDSDKFASQISSPTLIIHGTADNVVPFSEGKKLFEKITARKKFIEVQGAGHLGFSNEFLVKQMEGFFGEGGKEKRS